MLKAINRIINQISLVTGKRAEPIQPIAQSFEINSSDDTDGIVLVATIKAGILCYLLFVGRIKESPSKNSLHPGSFALTADRI